MDAFEPCARCARHIKTREAACPFCGSARTPGASVPRRQAPRVSRAAWLASTLALAGCSAAVSPAESPAESDAATSDAAKDVQTRGPSDDAATDDEASKVAEASYDDAGAEAGYDAGAEAEAGWHPCYGAPPARLERAFGPAESTG